MLSGYIRVSKRDGSQVLDLQRDALTEAGVDASRIYEDLASGRQDDRPGLSSCLKALQPGNTLVVWKLDRLGRDLKHLIGLVDLFQQRQVGFKVLASVGAQVETTTANGRFIFGIFAALAEFEAALIRERTQAGLPAARARGHVGGRPRKMTATALTMAMTALADPRNAAKEVAQRLGLTTTTLYTYVNGDGSPKAVGQHLLDTAKAAEPPAARPGSARHAQPS
jgi:DNA invertase Pin-like site-specific DNA recombinase